MKEVKNIDIDDFDRDILLRQARILYPEVEEWILNMSVESYMNQLKTENMEEVN
jgi:hypothetical protein